MAFIDARRLDRNARIEADICIVGGGAAGISLAHEFINTRYRVALLESGGLKFRHRPQFLYIGDNIGLDNFPLARSRYRQFGGSTTRWTGQCGPLETIDFTSRDWVSHSGWPFDRTRLQPWYQRAQRVCQLEPYEYQDGPWHPGEGRTLVTEENGIVTRRFQFAWPLDFAQVYHQALEQSENVTVYLNANALEVDVNADATQVTGLRLATFNGKQIQASAAAYVLAAGGIENPRLLLASNRVEKNGVGNRNDLVGRFFMDHPYFFSGYYEPAEPAYADSLHVVGDYARMGIEQRSLAVFSLSDDVMREEQLVNCGIFFVRRPNYKTQPGYFSPANRSFTHVIDVLRHADLPDGKFGKHLRQIVAGSGEVAAMVKTRLHELLRPHSRLALRAQLEPTPNPDSRVSLTAERDRLGMPRVSVDWRLNSDDKRSLIRAHERLAQVIERRGLGRLLLDFSEDSNGWPNSMSGGKHHMGTTRMHNDPRQGVVDADCRVHGLGNLYIAGSSVFPTAGYANPTLTLVALALRLADHLKNRE